MVVGRWRTSAALQAVLAQGTVRPLPAAPQRWRAQEVSWNQTAKTLSVAEGTCKSIVAANLDQHLAALRTAGFTEGDGFWKDLRRALYGNHA